MKASNLFLLYTSVAYPTPLPKDMTQNYMTFLFDKLQTTLTQNTENYQFISCFVTSYFILFLINKEKYT